MCLVLGAIGVAGPRQVLPLSMKIARGGSLTGAVPRLMRADPPA